MKQSAICFGNDQSLVGIYTRAAASSGKMACLLVNAGILPRMGPNRLNVKIARQLAQAGIPSLRFDLPGLGDSLNSLDSGSFRDQARAAIAQAIGELINLSGRKDILLIGICSGADLFFDTALDDQRIRGLAMLEGSYPKTSRYFLNKFFNADRWLRFLTGRSHFWKNLGKQKKSRSRGDSLQKQDMATGIRQLSQRGCQQLFVFRDGNVAIASFEARHRKGRYLFKETSPNIHLAIIPQADHTFTLKCSQGDLLRALGSWVGKMV